MPSESDEFPQRQNPAAGVHARLGHSNIVLLTINTEGREPCLANETVHQILRQTWSEATAWLVGDYLLMPDHLHLFCAPRDLNVPIETWIKYWKREFSLKHKRLAGTLAPPTAGVPWFLRQLPPDCANVRLWHSWPSVSLRPIDSNSPLFASSSRLFPRLAQSGIFIAWKEGASFIETNLTNQFYGKSIRH